jgi:hypothetical protein
MSCVFEKLERRQNLPNRTNQPRGKKAKKTTNMNKIAACIYTNRKPNKQENFEVYSNFQDQKLKIKNI